LYEKGEGFIWLTNTHKNGTITLKKGTCLVEIQVISECELNEGKNFKRSLVNTIDVSNPRNRYPLTRPQFLEKFKLDHIQHAELREKLCELLWNFRDIFSTCEEDIGLIPSMNILSKLQGYP
jgi:hypothetical protein